MMNDEKDYPRLRTEIRRFFDEELPELIREADRTFQEPLRNWLKETQKESVLLRKENKDAYSRSVTVLNKKLPDLKKVITHQEANPRAVHIQDHLASKIATVPEFIEEMQSESRYRSLEDDKFHLYIIKGLKRILRSFSKGKQPEQTIPFRDLLLSELVGDTAWLQIWISESYKDQSEILELFLEKPEPVDTETDAKEKNNDTNKENSKNKDGEKKGKENKSFRIDVIDLFEKHLEQVIKRIESTEILENRNLDDYLELIEKRLTFKSERAGTVEGLSPSIRYSDIDSKHVELRFREKLDTLESSWITCLKSIRNDLYVQNEIATYGLETTDAKENILEELHTFFRDFGYSPIKNVISKAHEIKEEVNKAGKNVLTKKMTDSLRDKIENEILKNFLANMTDQDAMKTSLDRIRGEVSNLQLEHSHFTETIKLAEQRTLSLPQPKITFDELKWQSLASRYIQEKALREINPDKMELIAFVQELTATVEENIQIIDVNLAAAYESKKEEENPHDIALSGVDRAINLFEDSIKSIREKQNEYEEIINNRLDETLKGLADIMLARDYDKLEMQDKALQVREKALRWSEKLANYFSDRADYATVLWRFMSQKVRKGMDITARFLGFAGEEGISSKQKRSLSEYLAKSLHEQELPFIYRRLFEPGFEIDERFHVAPNGFYTAMDNAFNAWKEGLETNVLILGERGSGKSNAIRFSEGKFFENTDVIHVLFDRTFFDEETLVQYFSKALGVSGVKTVDELVEKIKKRRKRSVIAVENLQNAFIRNMHGFKAIEAFWVLMSSTKDKLFWIASVTRYTWNFFDKVSNADQYFSHINQIDNLTDEQIRKAIMVRHKATGYYLEFEPEPSIKNSRTYKKLISKGADEHEYLADLFFSKLADISEGNISVATIFWIQSIKDHDEKKIVMAPIEIADMDRLEVPSRNVLFTLAAFAIHDTLTEEQLSMALHQDVNESKLMLARLRSKGIVLNTEQGYRMNQLVYRQIIRMLKRRNILH